MRGILVRNRGIVSCGGGRVVPATAECLSSHCGGPVGACCLGNQCEQRTQAACLAAGGRFLGGPCLPETCVPAPCCAHAANRCHFRDGARLAVLIEQTTTLIPDLYFSCSRSDYSTLFGQSEPISGGGCGINRTAYLTGQLLPIQCGGQSTWLNIAGDQVSAAVDLLADAYPLANYREQPIPFPTCTGPLEFSDSFNVAGVAGVYPPVHIARTIRMGITGGEPCSGGVGGACCHPTGCYETTDEIGCASAGGVFVLGGTCDLFSPLYPCQGVTLGACCFPDGSCAEPLTFDQCRAAGASTFNPNSQPVGAPYSPVCPLGFCPIPPAPCCSGSSCNACWARGSLGAQTSITVQATADAYAPSGGQCVLVQPVQNSTNNTSPIPEDQCDWSISTTTLLMHPSGGSLPVSGIFRSCDSGLGLGPHVVIQVSGLPTQRVPVNCSGGAVVQVMGDVGGQCNGSNRWKNVVVNISASTTQAYQCPQSGLLLPLQRNRRLLLPGVDFDSRGRMLRPGGCGGCGGKVKETRGGLI